MKKLLFIAVLCLAIPASSAFAANLGAFTNLSGAVKRGASVTVITTNGTGLTFTKTQLTGGVDHAILGAVDANFNQEFRDAIIFNEGALVVRGTLLASHGNKASGPASFLFESTSQLIKGSAKVEIVGPNNKGKATVLLTFQAGQAVNGTFPKGSFSNLSTVFNNATATTSTLDGQIKLPAMQKAKPGALTNYSSTFFGSHSLM